MAIREILDYRYNERELRRKSRPVEKFDSHLHTLLDDMAETMREAGGVGLAAPQVGVLRRCVVIDVGEDAEGFYHVEGMEPIPVGEKNAGLVELVNPVLICAEGEHEWEEGCLSVPGMRGHTVRPQKVRMKAQNRDGKPFEIEGENLLALALVHECEHLDGKMYIDSVEGDIYPESAPPEDEA